MTRRRQRARERHALDLHGPRHERRTQACSGSLLRLERPLPHRGPAHRGRAHDPRRGGGFAADKLAPRVEEAYLEEKTDPAIFREMGEAGLLGITIPEEYGGLGAGYVTYGLVAREVERVDCGYRSMMSVQSSLVMYPDPRLRLRGAAQEVPAEARHAANGSAASA